MNVEQAHEFETKQAVEEYGVDRFVAECREFVAEQRAVMDEEFRDLAVWMDWDDVYQTMDPEYVDVVWDAFAALYDRGLVERGHQVVNTCPRCETAVSDSRLEYEDRTVEAVYVGFSLADGQGTLVAWTTTPWTLVGNQFVAVDAEGEYAAVEVDAESSEADDPLYVAAERVPAVMDALGVAADDYAVTETLPGSDLVGLSYDHPLADRLLTTRRPAGSSRTPTTSRPTATELGSSTALRGSATRTSSAPANYGPRTTSNCPRTPRGPRRAVHRGGRAVRRPARPRRGARSRHGGVPRRRRAPRD
ncbi:class I tRNA ligase family protein [Halosimplex aquaticum]